MKQRDKYQINIIYSLIFCGISRGTSWVPEFSLIYIVDYDAKWIADYFQNVLESICMLDILYFYSLNSYVIMNNTTN